MCRYGNKIYGNPGFVGQPRDRDGRSAFATYDEGNFEFHGIEYDIDQVGSLMEKAGFNRYYYGCLYDRALSLHI